MHEPCYPYRTRANLSCCTATPDRRMIGVGNASSIMPAIHIDINLLIPGILLGNSSVSVLSCVLYHSFAGTHAPDRKYTSVSLVYTSYQVQYIFRMKAMRNVR